MILYQYKCENCNHVYEEVRDIDQRKTCPCPECKGMGYKTLGAASADVNFRITSHLCLST
jgi:putative FmdB family regulatory protein